MEFGAGVGVWRWSEKFGAGINILSCPPLAKSRAFYFLSYTFSNAASGTHSNPGMGTEWFLALGVNFSLDLSLALGWKFGAGMEVWR